MLCCSFEIIIFSAVIIKMAESVGDVFSRTVIPKKIMTIGWH